jgi:hypothetical protein
MQPNDFLNLAKRLILSADEAERRTAISRAYYYVYHHIKNNLVDLDTDLYHEKMIDCIQEAKINDEKQEKFEILAEALKNLKTDRKFADYILHKTLNQKTCDTMIKRCLDVVNDFEECKQIGIIDAARNYLRQFNYIR